MTDYKVNETLTNKLNTLESKNQLRTLKLTSGLIDFASNDYLGLARNEELADKISQEYSVLSTSLGSGGSRLLAGNSAYIEELELFLANVHQSESALVMNSGYVANLAVFSTVPQKGDVILYDELIHASIKDGMRLSLAKHFSFKHNDLASLESKLKKITGVTYVAVESVYSMDGDTAPLFSLINMCNKYGAYLIVDEAHSTGIFGKNGSGLCCELGLENEVFIRIHTFGKGMGCHGACVTSSQQVKDFLINFSRPFIYTTAMPLHGLVTIKQAYKYVSKHEWLRDSMKQKISFFKHNIQTSTKSDSPIQVVIITGNENVKNASLKLQETGLDVRPVMSPTVKKGHERLRICLHTYNSEEEIAKLGNVLSLLNLPQD